MECDSAGGLTGVLHPQVFVEETLIHRRRRSCFPGNTETDGGGCIVRLALATGRRRRRIDNPAARQEQLWCVHGDLDDVMVVSHEIATAVHLRYGVAGYPLLTLLIILVNVYPTPQWLFARHRHPCRKACHSSQQLDHLGASIRIPQAYGWAGHCRRYRPCCDIPVNGRLGLRRKPPADFFCRRR